MTIGAVYLGIILIVLCLYSMHPAITVKEKVEAGQFLGKMVYTDEGGGKLLLSSTHNLQGKPDYIFQSLLSGRYIPFEIKSGKCKEDTPHLGDLMQLVAYFIIIEEVYGKKPSFGKLVYANKTFKVRNTRKLRKELLVTLKSMRNMLDGHLQEEVEPSFVKCKNCICRHTVCEWYEEIEA